MKAVRSHSPWSFLTVALLAVSLGLTACGKKPEAPAGKGKNAQAPRAVRISSVQMRSMSGGLTANGVFAPREEAVVGSELSGYRVSRVFADVDSWVRQGQPLVQLDDTLLRSQIAQQRAATAQAEDQAKRVQGLDEQGVLSQEQVVQRRLAAAASRAALNTLLTQQSRMTIRAPVSGRVMERTVRPGDVASPATPMFRIIRDGIVELEANVPEADLGLLRPGTTATVTPSSGAPINGTIRIISPAVDGATKLGRVRILLPPRADLRPGGFGRVTFAGGGGTRLAAPETAIRYGAQGASIMVLDAQNKAHEVKVRTGQHVGGWVELLEGPREGSRVLLGGSAFVLEGDTVKPVMAAN